MSLWKWPYRDLNPGCHELALQDGLMVGNFSTRFSLPSFVRRVEKLTDDQRNAIKKMGFGHLLEMPIQTLNKNLLVELMERWSCEKHAFILLPGEITITLMDVALILGLRVMGDSVVLKEDEPFSDLEKEYGATISNRKIMVSSIENKLESIAWGIGARGFKVLTTSVCYQITWELQLTSEELEIDIIKELIAAQNDRTDVSKPEYPSSIMLTVDDDNLRIRSHLMDKQAVENGSEREIVREGHRIQENNLEHLRAPENVVEVLTDATGCPSASCCVSEEPKEQMQHPSTSKNSSMNFTISVEDDLRTRYQLLEEQNMKLMEEIDKLRRENNILGDQLLSSQQLKGRL
ncbi:Protein MAIN-like 1 [Vitis vinifera]|uniref:Protein MAIN-like 1 n=1 Tax=Vitis vinifera TaxID=29760 RepID=A0A438IV96_VITVI|nr:Protein MAIN-like 1 [Vitis vinifera]